MSTYIIPRLTPELAERLETLDNYLRVGFKLTPIKPGSKIPCLSKWQFSSRHIDTKQKCKNWLLSRKECNWGCITGKESGIFVVDIDHKNDGFGSLARLEAEHGKLPVTLSQTTGSGGKHLFFKYPSDDRPIKNSAGRVAPGIDIRSDRGQVVIEPSVHPETGKPYKFDMPPGSIEIAQAPEWLLEKIVDTKPVRTPLTPEQIAQYNRTHQMARESDSPQRKYAKAVLRNNVDDVLSASPGKGNDALNKAAFTSAQYVPGGLLTEQEIYDALLEAATAGGRRGISEANATIMSGIKAGCRFPKLPPERPRCETTGIPDGVVAHFDKRPGMKGIILFTVATTRAVESTNQGGADLGLNSRHSEEECYQRAIVQKSDNSCNDYSNKMEPSVGPAGNSSQAICNSVGVYEDPHRCPKPCSNQSQYDQEVEQGGRLFSCDKCRYESVHYACEECGQKVGTRRPFPGVDPCRNGPRKLLQRKKDFRQCLMLNISCKSLKCPKCSWRYEFDALVHYRSWGPDLSRGIIWKLSHNIADKSRIKQRISKTAHKIIVPKVHKHLVSNYLSKLRKKFGVLFVCVYLGFEKFAFLVFNPISKRGGLWKKLSSSKFRYHCVRGKNKGLTYSSTPVTMSDVDKIIRDTLARAGNGIKLDRSMESLMCDSNIRNHRAISYCKELRPPERNTTSQEYNPAGDVGKDDEAVKSELKAQGATVHYGDPTDLDKSHMRGLNLRLCRLIRIQFPATFTKEQVDAILSQLTTKPWLAPSIPDAPIVPSVGRIRQPSMFI